MRVLKKRVKSTGDALRFTGIIVREGEVYFSLCPELDVSSQGTSIGKAKAMLREAVTGYLEVCFESNLPFLRPTPSSEDPRNTDPQMVVSIFWMRVNLAIKAHG